MVLSQPMLVALAETLLDASSPNIALTGYALVSRLDRRGQQGGGIALFARTDEAAIAVHTCDSVLHERSWHLLHTDVGLISLGLWHRPPSYSEAASISDLRSEIAACSESIGILIVGDMNVHNIGWLQLSQGASAAGRRLCQVCSELDLQECTAAPTRGPYLLDLTLSDFGRCITTTVLQGVSDHSMALCSCAFPLSAASPLQRHCFVYSRAKWEDLRLELNGYDWHRLLNLSFDVHSIAALVSYTVISAGKRHIPYRLRTLPRPVDPWIDAERLRAVAAKNSLWTRPSWSSPSSLHGHLATRMPSPCGQSPPEICFAFRMSEAVGEMTPVLEPSQGHCDLYSRSAALAAWRMDHGPSCES